jgi:hypothetical protein
MDWTPFGAESASEAGSQGNASRSSLAPVSAKPAYYCAIGRMPVQILPSCSEDRATAFGIYSTAEVQFILDSRLRGREKQIGFYCLLRF